MNGYSWERKCKISIIGPDCCISNIPVRGWADLSLFYLNWWGPGSTCIHVDRAGIAPLILKGRRAEGESRADEPLLPSCSETVHWSAKCVTWQPDSPEVCLWAGARVNVQMIFQHYLHIVKFIQQVFGLSAQTYLWAYSWSTTNPWTAEGQNSSGWSCEDEHWYWNSTFDIIYKCKMWYIPASSLRGTGLVFMHERWRWAVLQQAFTRSQSTSRPLLPDLKVW